MDLTDGSCDQISGTQARKDYFLTSDNLKSVPHKIPPWFGFGMGRATRYYKRTDLKQMAEQVYGVEGFAEKVEEREKRNTSKRKRESEKFVASKKKKAVTDTLVSKLTPVPTIADHPSFFAFIQGLEKQQMHQLFALLSEKHPDTVARVNALKDTCRLNKEHFAELEPKLDKLMRASDGNADQAFKKCQQKLDRAAATKQKHIEHNKRMLGRWDLCVTEPANRRNETGTLKLDDFSDGYMGKLELGGEFYADVDGFSKGHSIENSSGSILLNTDFYSFKKYWNGNLRLKLSTNNGDLHLEGSWNVGTKGMGDPKTIKFLGERSVGYEIESDNDH